MSEPQEFIAKEKQGEGELGWRLWREWFGSFWGGHKILPLLLLLFVIDTSFANIFRWLISVWMEDCQKQDCSPLYQWGKSWLTGEERWVEAKQLALFVGLGMIFAGMMWVVQRFVMAVGALRLHGGMTRAFARVRVSFYDQQPTGRLIRRFGSDYLQVIDHIPNHFSETLAGCLILLWTVALVAMEAPWVALVCLPCAALYYYIQKLYRPARREVQRLSKVLESPVWALFNETIHGFQVIRNYGKNQHFAERLERLFYQFGLSWISAGRMNRWLTIQLKLVSDGFGFCCTLYAIWAVQQGHMGAAMAGFLMSLVSGLDGTMQWMTKSYSMLETSMVSMERILEYQDLPSEAERIDDDNRELPGRGRLELRDVVAAYRPELPDVINGMNLNVDAGSKVGIIGRTGVGKSTLFQLLFRMMDVKRGSIIVDGHNLLELPIETARRHFGVVPQQPHLFSGSVRSNLDRGMRHLDEDLWQALEQVHLKSFVRELPGGLDYHLAEGGKNLSVGQRQLICMARAMLANSPIILMDEATANVDNQTDKLIIESTRKAFREKTVLIIAHRLQTLEFCDVIVEIDQGRVHRMFNQEQFAGFKASHRVELS